MKLFFTVFLVLNLLAETLAAVSLIGGGLGGEPTDIAAGTRWDMNYGFAVIAIASAVFWLWTKRSTLAAVTPVLGMLTVFHVSLVVALSMDASQRFGFILHGVLALMAIILFTQRRKWCTD